MLRVKVLKINREQQMDKAFMKERVQTFLKDAKGASDIFREVRAVLERKLARQM